MHLGEVHIDENSLARFHLFAILQVTQFFFTLLVKVKIINLLNQHTAGIAVFVALFFWENKKEEQQITNISRNETLSRLPVRLSTNRITELVQLRDITRPVSIILLSSFILYYFSFVFSLSGLLIKKYYRLYWQVQKHLLLKQCKELRGTGVNFSNEAFY